MATAKMAPEYLSTLRLRLGEARRQTDELFAMLREDALYDRPIPERHRLIFYLGHLEAFDWNLLAPALRLQSNNQEFDKLFAFGIDPVDGKLPNEPASAWPHETVVRAYNKTSRERIDAGLSAYSASLPPLVVDGTLLNVAIEHRLMHAETLAYLFHQLPYGKKRAANVQSRAPSNVVLHEARSALQSMCDIPEGDATLGMRSENGVFGWDNEFEEHRVHVPRFRIRAFPVTNGEYLEFMRNAGYEDNSLWSAEGWKWKEAAGISHPLFWAQSGESWEYCGMFVQFPLPVDWPVYVSHAEAAAFAQWSKQSLPTEAQWHRAAYGVPNGDERKCPWGDASAGTGRGNFDFQHWDATPVTAYPSGQSAFGVQDLLGNGWEWTSTAFAAFPGFEAFPFYPGYSANFFDGKHFVMKGGSARTAECMLRRSYRNWFQPHYPYVYAKFRTVEV